MKRPSTLLVSLAIVFVVLVLGGGVFFAVTQSNKKNMTAENTAATKGTAGLRTNDYSDNPEEARKNQAGGDGTDPTGTDEASASAAFTDGLYLVGKNIEAGKYRSDGSGDCSWKRLNALSGFKNVIAESTVNGPTTIKIESSDKAFTSSGCGT